MQKFRKFIKKSKRGQAQLKAERPKQKSLPNAKELAEVINYATLPEDIEVKKSINILTYNVWFNESAAVNIRMATIARLTEVHNIDILGFQECTANIMKMLTKYLPNYTFFTQNEIGKRGCRYFVSIGYRNDSEFWNISNHSIQYHHFETTTLDRGLLYGKFKFTSKADESESLIINFATSHLESPVQNSAPKRADQLKKTGEILSGFTDDTDFRTIFLGDLNWLDNFQYPMENPNDFKDVWAELHGEKAVGYTYDQRENDMIGQNNFRNRLDRVLVLGGVEDMSIEIIGKEKIGSVTYNSRYGKQLPVLPSDHYGVVTRILF